MRTRLPAGKCYSPCCSVAFLWPWKSGQKGNLSLGLDLSSDFASGIPGWVRGGGAGRVARSGPGRGIWRCRTPLLPSHALHSWGRGGHTDPPRASLQTAAAQSEVFVDWRGLSRVPPGLLGTRRHQPPLWHKPAAGRVQELSHSLTRQHVHLASDTPACAPGWAVYTHWTVRVKPLDMVVWLSGRGLASMHEARVLSSAPHSRSGVPTVCTPVLQEPGGGWARRTALHPGGAYLSSWGGERNCE